MDSLLLLLALDVLDEVLKVLHLLVGVVVTVSILLLDDLLLLVEDIVDLVDVREFIPDVLEDRRGLFVELQLLHVLVYVGDGY